MSIATHSLTDMIVDEVTRALELNRAAIESTGLQLSSLTVVVLMNTKEDKVRDVVLRPEGRVTPQT